MLTDADLNEAEIVSSGGLHPIVAATAIAADFLSPAGKLFTGVRTAKINELHDELAAQCAR